MPYTLQSAPAAPTYTKQGNGGQEPEAIMNDELLLLMNDEQLMLIGQALTYTLIPTPAAP